MGDAYLATAPHRTATTTATIIKERSMTTAATTTASFLSSLIALRTLVRRSTMVLLWMRR
jgi:hypothetical protein